MLKHFIFRAPAQLTIRSQRPPGTPLVLAVVPQTMYDLRIVRKCSWPTRGARAHGTMFQTSDQGLGHHAQPHGISKKGAAT
jgi:hypothetical protein